MNPLYGPLPDALVDSTGASYKIITDFREWIKFIDLVKDESVPNEDKFYLFCEWYMDKRPADDKEALNLLCDFLTVKTDDPADGEEPDGVEIAPMPEISSDDEEEKPKEKKVFSFSFDAPYIIAAFQECYGIDLLHIDYMHWWQFRYLLDGLNEKTEFMKRIAYRSIDVSKIKDKKERNRIIQIQRKIALPGKGVSDYDIGNAFV